LNYNKYGNYLRDLCVSNESYSTLKLSTVVKIDNIDDFISIGLMISNHPGDISITNEFSLVIMKVGDL